MTETQPTEFEDMVEPELCPHCDRYFDADIRANWVSTPFHLICGQCGTNIWPENEVKWQER